MSTANAIKPLNSETFVENFTNDAPFLLAENDDKTWPEIEVDDYNVDRFTIYDAVTDYSQYAC